MATISGNKSVDQVSLTLHHRGFDRILLGSSGESGWFERVHWLSTYVFFICYFLKRSFLLVQIYGLDTTERTDVVRTLVKNELEFYK